MSIIVTPLGLNTGGLTVGPLGMTSNAVSSGGGGASTTENLYIGSTQPTAIYVGSTQVTAIYKGSTLIWGS